MNALFWWTGFVWWACVVMAGVLTVALWVKGKMMARGAARSGHGAKAITPPVRPAPAPFDPDDLFEVERRINKAYRDQMEAAAKAMTDNLAAPLSPDPEPVDTYPVGDVPHVRTDVPRDGGRTHANGGGRMKVVINACYGGFSLSDAAYEKLIEWGVPVRKWKEQTRGSDGRYDQPPENEGEVIFDRELTLPGENESHDHLYHAFKPGGLLGRYWDTWIEYNRSHPLLVRLVEEMGAGHRTGASGKCADLRVVEIPDGVEYTIEEYDGLEHVAEKHRTWR